MEITDPRIRLQNELTSIGLPYSLSSIVALEAGGSQAVVGKKYIREIGVPKEMEELIFERVSKFYLGYYDED